MRYPSKVMSCSYGKCLVATRDLPAGTTVQTFSGPVITYAPGATEVVPPGVTDEDVRYMMIVDNKTVIIPKSDARYIDHSCDPNCDIYNKNEVLTTRPVKKGDELTISYNVTTKGDDPGPWDHRWDFDCKCGAANCQGKIDKYVYPEDGKWMPVERGG